jgi:hypothetical protein
VTAIIIIAPCANGIVSANVAIESVGKPLIFVMSPRPPATIA